ncbi:MAG: MmcQ/YjbR family DNA-binding protein [Alphaproteobacteria bacterium]
MPRFALATARRHALALPGAGESFPFGPGVAVIKAGGRIFALLRQRPGLTPADPAVQEISLKCDPDRAIMLRQVFESIRPGYHLNKRHWNTITLDGSVPARDVRSLIEHSWTLVTDATRQRPTRRRS